MEYLQYKSKWEMQLGMKKTMGIIFYVFIVLSFTACSYFDLKPRLEPSEVTIDGVTYRRGFYDDLIHPVEITFQEGSYTVNDVEYRRVNYEQFDYVHCKGGGTTLGLLYCAEEQWEQAKAYYTDSDNFVYYCQIGVKDYTRVPVVTAIPDMDPEKLDALINFAAENRYDPFSSTKKVETRRLPIPDRDESPAVFFYKECKDGFLTSNNSRKFYVDDDKLVALYFYDYGHGEYEEMEVVDVPDELSQYFVELVKQCR